jgi:hypothetical protein
LNDTFFQIAIEFFFAIDGADGVPRL